MVIKGLKWVLFAAFLAAGIGPACADRVHSHVDVMIGPMWGPPVYRPYYYYPSYVPLVIERSPPVYIEQSAPPPATVLPPAAPAYWYFCPASKAYYPYVSQCPSGWQVVPAKPQGVQ